VTEIHVADPVKEYILDVVEATRDSPDVRHGASPRAALAFISTTKGRAAIRGREYVIPDDVKALGQPVLRHRLIRTTDAELADTSIAEILEDIFSRVDPPGSDTTFAPTPALEHPQD
jgi:MoxR-like ATPase